MALNGSGVYLVNSTGQPVVANTLISAAVFNAFTADVAAALSTAIMKDGQQTVTANISLGGYKLTGLGAATAAGDSVRIEQLQNQIATAFTTAGTATAFTLTPTPAITANAANQRFRVKFNAAAGANPTLAISGQPELNLKYRDSTGAKQAITSTQVPINWESDVVNDGTDLVVLEVAAGNVGATSINGGPIAGLRNFIINGGFDVWQRGTSFVDQTVSGTVTYAADRWIGNRTSEVAGQTITRVAGTAGRRRYGLKWQRTAGNAGTSSMYQYYSIATEDAISLAGKTVTFSFAAKTGANYSGGALTVSVFSGTGTDERMYAYTGSATVVSTTKTLTSTSTQYSVTGAVASNATELGVRLIWTPTGTAGADDSITLEECQLEVGSVATPFESRPYGLELALCQRYYTQATLFSGGFPSTTSSICTISVPAAMRTTPTAVTTGTYSSQPYGLTSTTSPTLTSTGTNLATFSATLVTSGATVGTMVVWAGTGIMHLSAEL